MPFLALINVGGYYMQLRALSLTDATKVIPILQTSTLLAVILGIVLLKEKEFVWKKIFAAIIALAGVFLLISV